ncbi:hypothetical protein Tco_1489343, partial [Tanacetum coccineum]
LPPLEAELLPSPLARIIVDRCLFVAAEAERRTLFKEGSLATANYT